MSGNPTAQDLMTPSPGWCAAHDPVQSAAFLMAEHDCGAVPVVDDPVNRRVVGVITDRDIVLRLVVPGKTIHDAQVRDAMSPAPVVVHVNATFEECARAMRERRVRRLVIVDDRGRVIGMVTDGDLARAAACHPELEHEIASLVEEVSRCGPAPQPPAATPVMAGKAAIFDRPNHRDE